MLTEKLRPQTLDDIVGQDHITKLLKPMVDIIRAGNGEEIPHLGFFGKQGTGKTATAIAFLKDAFGEEWDRNFIELNASDERSIGVIREKVKGFAKKGVLGSFEVDGVQLPIPFNVIFLDECDNLTQEAQSALRRIMEKYKNTRFILSGNYPHRIISPVLDRCAFSNTRFKPINEEDMTTYLDSLGFNIGYKALLMISEASSGSMRKALNILWTLTRIPTEVKEEDVEEYISTLNPKLAKYMLGKIIQCHKNKDKVHQLSMEIDRSIDDLAGRGMSGGEILHSIYNLTTDEDDPMPRALKEDILKSLGEGLYYASVSQDDILAVKCWWRKVMIE